MIKPMLAATWEKGCAVPYPVIASPKLDGVRALVQGGKLYSRSGKLVPNLFVQNSVDWGKFNGYDGELIVGCPTSADVFRATASGIMSIEGEPDFRFYVFDNFEIKDNYLGRLLEVMVPDGRVVGLQSCYILNEGELTDYEQLCIEAGYEGVMLRAMKGIYKHGRSTLKEFALVKVKRFLDGEAELLGFEELMSNQNEKTLESGGKKKRNHCKGGLVPQGKLGALFVRDLKTGVEFHIGTGFSEEERVRYWQLSILTECLIVKYRYFPTGSKDKPRFPVFVGFRSCIDL